MKKIKQGFVIFTLACASLHLNATERISWPSPGSLGEAKKVIGIYPRSQVKEASAFPFRTIGQIKLGCTGTLISPKHILTAGHCVYDTDADLWETELQFSPGKTSQSEIPFGVIDWKKVFIQRQYLETGSKIYDFAVIELAQPIGDKVGFSGFKAMSESDINNTIQITGYPGDKEKGTMWTVNCPAAIEAEAIIYKCDTYGGMSGSGIFTTNLTLQQSFITAVHTWGTYDSNGGVIINERNFDLINAWKSEGEIPSDTVIHEQ